MELQPTSTPAAKKRVRTFSPEQRLARIAASRAWAANNKVLVASRSKSWAEANPDRIRSHSAAHYANNKDKKRLQSAAWMESNQTRAVELAATRYLLNKPAINASNAAWKALNPVAVLSHKAKRRAAQLNRSPDWDQDLTEFASTEAYDFLICGVQQQAASGTLTMLFPCKEGASVACMSGTTWQ